MARWLPHCKDESKVSLKGWCFFSQQSYQLNIPLLLTNLKVYVMMENVRWKMDGILRTSAISAGTLAISPRRSKKIDADIYNRVLMSLTI